MFKPTRLLMLLITGFVVFISASCAPRDDERELRELVEKAARLAEQHEIGAIMDLTTEDFEAQPGKMDRRGAKRILFMAFRHYGELKVAHPRPSVDLEPKEGRASVSVPFFIIKKDKSMPELKDLYSDPKGWIEKVGENADLYRLKLVAVKKDGDWLVRRARLEKFTGVGFSE